MSTAAFGTEKDCTGEALQQLQTTDPPSRQRGHPTFTDPQLSKDN
jgi:hypothetical protein